MAPKVKSIVPSITSSGRRNTGAARRIRTLKMQHPELSEATIAKHVGCTPSNVHRVLKRFLGNNTENDLRDYQNAKADVFDALQHRFHSSITDADISKAPLLARVTSAAILEDKARNIRGQANQVNVTVLLDAVSAIREMRRD